VVPCFVILLPCWRSFRSTHHASSEMFASHRRRVGDLRRQSVRSQCSCGQWCCCCCCCCAARMLRSGSALSSTGDATGRLRSWCGWRLQQQRQHRVDKGGLPGGPAIDRERLDAGGGSLPTNDFRYVFIVVRTLDTATGNVKTLTVWWNEQVINVSLPFGKLTTFAWLFLRITVKRMFADYRIRR